MGTNISHVKTNDLEALGAFACHTFTENFGHLYLPEHLNTHLQKTCSTSFFAHELEQGAHILLAKEKQQIIGYVKYGRVGLPIAHGNDDREMHRCYIDRMWQGKGLGRRLCLAALAEAELQAAPHVFLGVWEENIRAQKLYTDLGFKPVGRYLYAVGPHRDREIIMRKSKESD